LLFTLAAGACSDDDPVGHLPDAPVEIDAPPAPTCPALTGQELVHSTDITTAETWVGDGTVHHIAFGITIRAGGSLTLAPCAIVKIDSGLILTVTGTVAAPAKLVSLGTASQPVLLTNAVAGQKWGMWRGLSPDSTFDLSYTTLENGGNNGVHGCALNARASAPGESAAVPIVRANHLTIKDSAGTGIVLESGAAFTADSTQLTVTGGGTTPQGDYAIELSQIAAGTLPPLTVSGNVHDAIRIAGGTLYISRDLTLKKLGVPYYFYFDRVRISDQAGLVIPTLTIQAGVEVRFDDYLQVGYVNPGISNTPGKLIAVGTVAEPIVFTSSKTVRAAGDWPGIHLFNSPGSRLEHVRIEYAGGFNGISSANCKPAGSTDNAALFVGSSTYSYIPAATDFVDVNILNSASHAINAMWETSGALAPDLTAGFTFSAINGCKQTKNRTTIACPGGNGCTVN
jgi:hypothetical protein